MIHTTPQPALALEKIDINHGDGARALSGISTAVHKGEFVVLTGMSGSGKTSLLRAIQGHLNIAAGTLAKHGHVATIYQDLRLVKQASALQNVLHGSLIRYRSYQLLFGFPQVEYTTASDLLASVGLQNKLNCRVKQLSGGEKQRVAIARALMQQPAILLADEPIASLDRQNARDTLKLLKMLAHDQQLAILCVLHDQELAEQFADRIIVLESGLIVEEYKPQADLQNKTKLTLLKNSEEPCQQQQFCHATCTVENCLHSPNLEQNIKFNKWLTLAVIFLISALTLWSLQDLSVFKHKGIAATFLSLANFMQTMLPNSIEQLQRIPWSTLLLSLAETIQMAFVATILGSLISLPLAILAAANLKLVGLKQGIRFLLNVVRTVPSLLWALLCVAALGLGPGAGVLALTAYSVGYLAKFFYEAFENIDPLAPNALKDLGASALQRFRFATWPAAQPTLIASVLFVFEYNIRAASILGIVDAGGIGFYLKQYIDFRFFPAVTAGLLLILVVVVLLDSVSSKIRKVLLAEK